ncbi:MAG TPA: helix-turn-helix transcriptional regulator [Natronosporangium sp.]
MLAGIERLTRAVPVGPALVRTLAARLQAVVPGEALLLLRTDPTTVLPTDGVVEALPPGMCQPFWDNELLEDDFNKFVTLARSGTLAATLREATGGELTRSRRYVSLYRPLGISDELRVSFTARDGSCWGIAQLVRTAGASFSSRERELLAAAAPGIAAVLRDQFYAGPTRPVTGGPALVILDRSGEIDSITPEAREWLAQLGSDTGMRPVPEPVYAVAGRARAARAGAAPEPACAQVRTTTGGWLHLHATCLETTVDSGGRADDRVAVVITPAQGSDLVPLLALGYRLTQRERQVLEFLARGMTTSEITARLGISPHTVRDHIKALFGKVGVRSRTELVGRIFAEHYFDRLEANLDRTPAAVDTKRGE